MARQAKGLPADELRAYIPTADGNRDDVDPVTVWIRNPTEGTKRRLSQKYTPTRFCLHPITGEPVLNPDGLAVYELDGERTYAQQVETLMLCVERVDNYTDQNGEPIDTAEKFIDHGDHEFVTEAYMEIMDGTKLSPAEKKRLNAQPGSDLAKTATFQQTAENAEQPERTSSAIVTADCEVSYTSQNMGTGTPNVQRAG